LTEYFKIGKIVAVHGLKGELVLKHTLGKKSSLKGLQALFVEDRKDSFLPWFIQETKIKNEEETILKLDTINTREDAKKLTQKEIWLPEPDFKKFTSKSSPGSLLGYNIINDGESLGPVLEVIEHAHQLLCRVEIKTKEVLVPINESTLQKINHNKKEVIVSLPEGLLDIYLG